MPERVQLRRTKGWRIPENTVSVARPGPFGNPFVVGKATNRYGMHLSQFGCVEEFRQMVAACADWRDRIKALHGKNLACWCKPGEPCHADVLLEMANPLPDLQRLGQEGEGR